MPPSCLSLSPSAQIHTLAFQTSAAMLTKRGHHEILQVSLAGGSNLGGNYGPSWKVCILHKTPQPQAYK